MRLTRNTTYALRIMMYCAANPREKSRIPDIAKSYSLSEPFLFKILQPLVEAKLLTTTRGRSGGISLGRPPHDISILDVVKVTEFGFAMAECFEVDRADCPLVDQCALNSALREALDAFFSVLQKHSIGDLVASRKSINRLLGLEHVE